MGRTPTGARLEYLGFDEALKIDFLAFCKAHFKAEEKEVIRTAVRQWIDRMVADEPKMAERFHEERRKIIDAKTQPVRLVKSRDDQSA